MISEDFLNCEGNYVENWKIKNPASKNSPDFKSDFFQKSGLYWIRTSDPYPVKVML